MTRRNWSMVCGGIAAAAAAWWWVAARGPDGMDASSPAGEVARSIVHGPDVDESRRADSVRDGEAPRAPDDLRGNERRRATASGFAPRSALYQRAAQASDEELAAMIDETRSIVDQIERVPALEILLLKLAERDVAAAVRAAAGGERADAYPLIATLATSNPEAVWRAVAQVGDPLARMEYQSAVVSVWVAHDPALAFATVASLPADWTREQLMRQSAWALARRDPKQAVDLVKTLPNAERRPLYEAVVQQWARHDPAAAAEWIEAQDVQMQGALAFQIANAYVAQQPEEALAWALRISRSPGRNLWSTMIGHIAAYDPEDALRRAQAAENPMQRAQALSSAIAAIAARDPTRATAYLDKLPPGNARRNAIAEVARHVAQLRPHGALDWLRDLPAGMRFDAVHAIASQLAESDPNAAAKMMDRVPRELHEMWIDQVAMAYARNDPEQGVEWLSKWGDQAGPVTFNFVHNVAMRDLDGALRAIDRLAEGAQRDQMLANVMGMVAMQAPDTAIKRMQDMEDDNMRMQAAASIAGAWAQQDATAARKWTTSLAAGPMRDAALSQVIAHIPSLEERISLLEQVQSPERRMSAVFTSAATMARSDPEGMRALLRRFPLDPQRQQQLDTIANSGQRFRGNLLGY